MPLEKLFAILDLYKSFGIDHIIEPINLKFKQTKLNNGLNGDSPPDIKPLRNIVDNNLFNLSIYSQSSRNLNQTNNKEQHNPLNINTSLEDISKKILKNTTLTNTAEVANGANMIVSKIEPRINLDDITNLVDLKEKLLKFDKCSLKKTAINTVFGSGNVGAKVMLIGEAPGAEEDEKGEPFVGRSGALLIKALASVNILREDIFITNTVFWRPPGNRNPTFEEISMCYPFLKKMIEIIKPSVIVLVGKISTQTILQIDASISKLRNKWHDVSYLIDTVDNVQPKEIVARVIFHPAYLLRNPSQKKILWQDLVEIKNKILKIP
ncbi:Uracil-DNA glycosylase [Candidatus Hepatincolaceae symbiont of Richtersius coronifer]